MARAKWDGNSSRITSRSASAQQLGHQIDTTGLRRAIRRHRNNDRVTPSAPSQHTRRSAIEALAEQRLQVPAHLSILSRERSRSDCRRGLDRT